MEAASADMSWKAIDRYSKDYIEMQTKDKVKFYKTPDSILQKELDAFDAVAAKKSAENPLFKEIIESQIAFAKRAVSWEMDTIVNRRMAYNHYFGPRRRRRRRPHRKAKRFFGITGGSHPGTARMAAFRKVEHAENTAPHRQDQHLRRENVFLAHRVAHPSHHL